MGLVVNFKTMQQPTILVTFFQMREYSQRTIGVELASWLASLIFFIIATSIAFIIIAINC